MISGKFCALLVGTALSLPTGALAQANANAVKGAGDAFGFKSGDESVGIYDETSVRGFNLESAGNYRVDGSYFVRNSGVSSFFLESTTVRVGYNTLGSLHPGPSGLVDYRLRDPRADEPDAVTIGLDVYSQPYVDIHLKHRDARDRHSYSIGLSRVFDVRDAQGGRGGESLLVGGAGRISRGDVIGRFFAGEYQYERKGQFRVTPAADRLPPRIERGRYLGPDWAEEKGQRRIAGMLVDADLAGGAGIGVTGVFSQEDPTRGFAQLFTDLTPDGTARASVIAIPQQRSTAWSGELRAHKAWQSDRLSHRIDATMRGRRQRARFGGAVGVDLGRGPFGERPADRAPPSIDDAGAKLRDAVDQWGWGLAYRATVGDRARLNLGVLKTDYRKTFRSIDGTRRTGEATPILYNVGGAWRAGADFELYGSYSRGLEEAGVAPATASNRNEVLEAILVTQREAGLRFFATDDLTLVVAGFDTRKPYAGIDAATGAYRFLGQVRHRGVEASLSGRAAPGLSVVVGGVLIDPELSGPEVDAGRIGSRPVGVPRIRAIASADYALPTITGLSVDIGGSVVGRRAARSRLAGPGVGQLEVPALATVNVGARYRFAVAGADIVVRAQVQNALDSFAWEVNGSETLAYAAPRRYRLLVTTLF